MRKETSYYVILAFTGLVIWIIETTYFGFNKHPKSGIESILDFVSMLFLFWGVTGNILINAFKSV